MKLVKTPIVVFCDANTMLGKNLLKGLYTFSRIRKSDVYLVKKGFSARIKIRQQALVKDYIGNMNQP